MSNNYVVVIESRCKPEYGHAYCYNTKYGISFDIKKSKKILCDLYEGYVCRSETPTYMRLEKYCRHDESTSVVEISFKESDYEL